MESLLGRQRTLLTIETETLRGERFVVLYHDGVEVRRLWIAPIEPGINEDAIQFLRRVACAKYGDVMDMTTSSYEREY